MMIIAGKKFYVHVINYILESDNTLRNWIKLLYEEWVICISKY